MIERNVYAPFWQGQRAPYAVSLSLTAVWSAVGFENRPAKPSGSIATLSG